MDNLIESLILRRLCVSSLCSIFDLRNKTIKSNCIDCNGSNHIACVFISKGSHFQSPILWNQPIQ